MSESPLHKLIEWYRKHVKPFFLDHGLEKVEEYDAEIKRLERIQATLQAKLPACFLGNAGIGKSTLINAVVFGKDIYIPSGGVGPLTAQALTVCHGEHSSFEVLYHTTERYNQLVFGLHQSFTAKVKREAGKENPSTSPEELGLELNGQEEKAELENISNEPGEEQARRMEDLRKQACLMIAGRQDSQREVSYLIDALLAASGKPIRHGTTLLDEDKPRVERLKVAIQHGKSKQLQTHREGNSPEARTEFLKLLHDHATGFLAPLIKDLTVRWNEDLLRGGLIGRPGR